MGLEPTNLDALRGSADAAEKLGDLAKAAKLAPDNALAAENLRRQYTYVYPLAVPVAIIPFSLMAIFVMPVGAILMFVLTLFNVGQMVAEIRRKRKDLPPEFQSFLSTGSMLGDGSSLDRFGNAIWTLFEKAWKPHLLALAAVFVSFSGVRLVAWLMMFASFSGCHTS